MSAAIELLIRTREANQACALVTIARIDGRAPRRVGAQMAISLEASAGSLTGGCLDATVIEQTRARLTDEMSFRLKFGADSPFMDLQLPCGSTMDLQIDCALAEEDLRRIQCAHRARQKYVLYWPKADQPARFSEALRADADMQFPYHPKLRIVAAGKGDTLLALAAIARACDLDFEAWSPEQATVAQLQNAGAHCNWLTGASPHIAWDAYTAAIAVFHDHDLELPFLRAALHAQPLLIAAMGAPRAAHLRQQALLEQGESATAMARIESPFGVIARARDPHTLAVSMIASSMQRYRDCYFPEVTAAE